jgi:hypothetical protein
MLLMIFPPLAFFIIIAVLQLFEEKTVVQFFAHENLHNP